MGILKDGPFWAGVFNRISALNPPIGQDISPGNAAEIRAIACDAFSALLNDPEFDQDLSEVIGLAKEASPAFDATSLPTYGQFVDLFMTLEAKLLRDAGLNTKAANELDRELRRAMLESHVDRLERLGDKIRYCQKLACNPEVPTSPQKTPLWKAVVRGVGGVTTIAVDAGATGGAAMVLGPAGAAMVGTVVGISVGAGASLIGEAIRGRW